MILLDYNSLLVALSFCSAGLALTFFVSWFVSQADRVLLTWGIGAAFMVFSILVYSDFVSHFSQMGGAIGFAALLVGLIFFWGAAHQFRTGVLPIPRMIVISTAAIAIMAAPMFQGYDGVCYIVFNIMAAGILFATGWEYWRWRAEAPLPILTLSGLYVLTGLSFLLCAAVLIGQGNWIMHHAPENWAENINLVVCLTAIAGIGALLLGLNQIRLTKRHKRDAETDALTGLFNRRALFNRALGLPASVAVIVFDIDHFKQVNDVHGHQMGDVVLQTFANIVTETIREGDLAARLGGEEFAVVLSDGSLKAALLVAERVRKRFSERRFISQERHFSNTVSVGISQVGDGAKLTDLIVQADAALYRAKRSGRDRVVLYSERKTSAPADETDAPAKFPVGPAADRSALYNSIADTARRHSERKGRLTRPM
jgi:diguanylate cyclase (GGDEF)-like protein